MKRPSALRPGRALLLVWTLAAVAPGAAGAARPAARAAADLPDTVLAQLGDDTRTETVTVRDLQEVARKRGAAPDSLAPAQVRELLGALLDRRAIRLAAGRERPAWAPQDSAQYRDLAGQIEFEAALDSAFAVERSLRAARGDRVTDPGVLGAAMRDAALARLGPIWDDALVGRLAAAFAALPAPAAGDDLVTRARKLARFPAVAPADTDRAIATLESRPFRVRDLLREWRALRVLGRPHLADARQVKDFVSTALYQRVLRAQAHRDGVLARPANAKRLRDRAEALDAKAWAVRHAFSLVPRDSLTLRREFDRDPSRWDQPARAEVLRRLFATRAGADSLAARLRDRAFADSLAALERRVPDRVPDFVDARGDSLLAARCLAAGPGAVVGPDSLAGPAWRVVLVLGARARRARAFAEARDSVDRDWFGRESERRLRAALDDLRRAYGERVNERVIERLAPAGR